MAGAASASLSRSFDSLNESQEFFLSSILFVFFCYLFLPNSGQVAVNYVFGTIKRILLPLYCRLVAGACMAREADKEECQSP